MIIIKDGKTETVNTTNKEIDVIFYFPKLAKGLESIGTGSLTDKGKELIEQARNVNLQKLAKDLKLLPITNSNFREDRLSEVNQQNLKEREIINQWEGKPKNTTVGVKETKGKVDYSEINLGILDLMAERFSANKVKYPKGNTKKPLDKQEILWALFRHVKKMVQPIESDEENFKDHLGAVLTNCSIILDQLELEK